MSIPTLGKPRLWELLDLIAQAIKDCRVPFDDADLRRDLIAAERDEHGDIHLSARVRRFGLKLWREANGLPDDPYPDLPECQLRNP